MEKKPLLDREFERMMLEYSEKATVFGTIKTQCVDAQRASRRDTANNCRFLFP